MQTESSLKTVLLPVGSNCSDGLHVRQYGSAITVTALWQAEVILDTTCVSENESLLKE